MHMVGNCFSWSHEYWYQWGIGRIFIQNRKI